MERRLAEFEGTEAALVFSSGFAANAGIRAKLAFEKYFIHKIKTGSAEPIYEKVVLKALGVEQLETPK